MRKAEHSGGEVTAALVPTEVCSGLTLFQVEETITLLVESAEEEGLTAEIEQALAAHLQGVLEKRDRVAEFVLRVDGMALRVLDYFGVSKLEGGTHTLTKRNCPASVAVRNRTEISAEFKRERSFCQLRVGRCCWPLCQRKWRSKYAAKSSSKKLRLKLRRSRKC